LLAASLPRPNRLSVLYTLNLSKYDIGMKWLKDQAQAGKLPQGIRRGHLPQPLADVLDVYETIHKQYPDVSIWTYHAELAKQVRSFAPKVPPLAEFKGLKGPDAWALDIAMPVIKANADASAVKSAVQTVQAIIDERFRNRGLGNWR
jgi:hypothetical protein